jgi:hypothetical protein
MNQTPSVDLGEAGSDVADVSARDGNGAGRRRLEVGTFDELHREVRTVVVDPIIMHADDGWMSELRQRSKLALEAVHVAFLTGWSVEALQGQELVFPEIERAVDDPHSATPENAFQAISAPDDDSRWLGELGPYACHDPP